MLLHLRSWLLRGLLSNWPLQLDCPWYLWPDGGLWSLGDSLNSSVVLLPRRLIRTLHHGSLRPIARKRPVWRPLHLRRVCRHLASTLRDSHLLVRLANLSRKASRHWG